MERFTEKGAPVPLEDEHARASRVVERLLKGGRPADRMEAGLRSAMVGTGDRNAFSAIEDRRFANAFARGLARDREEDGVGMSSIDWARTFAVDASIQREAGVLLLADVLDRETRLRWGSSEITSEPWVQAGVPRSVFSKAAEADLKAMASGEYQELSSLRSPEIEMSLLSAAQPAVASLEARLHLASGTARTGATRSEMDEAVLGSDARAFGPVDQSAWTGAELAARSDRMSLARRAAEIGHRDARGLFDPTPGRSPFDTDHGHHVRAVAAVQGGDKGPFGRVVRAALAVLEEIDPPGAVSGDDGVRLAAAAGRLLKAGPSPEGDERVDVRVLVADVLVQKCAADMVFGTTSPARGVLEEMVSGNPDFRESVGFWRRGEEERMKDVAFGRFQGIDDSTGLASGIRNTIWRAETVGSWSMEQSVEKALAEQSGQVPGFRPGSRVVTGSRGPRQQPPVERMKMPSMSR